MNADGRGAKKEEPSGVLGLADSGSSVENECPSAQDGLLKAQNEALERSNEPLSVSLAAQNLRFEPLKEYFRPLVMRDERDNLDVLRPVGRGRAGR